MDDLIANGVSIDTYLDTRSTLKTANEAPLFRVRLRVTHRRKTWYVATNMSFTQEDWKRIHAEKPRQEYKKIRLALAEMQTKAERIAEAMPLFSIDEFKRRFLGKKDPKAAHNVFDCIEAYRAELIEADRLNTADTYRYTHQSLQRFWGKPILAFAEITPQFLARYESWGKKQQLSPTTLGMYLRNLRKIYNDAVATKRVPADAYPFGTGRGLYRIPTGTGAKISLSTEELKTLLAYEPHPDTSESLYFDVWRFSYYCNGINIKDICRLKYADIDERQGLIAFVRAKTEHTSRTLKPITAVLFEPTQKIIERHGTQPKKYENYVFPFLREGMSAQEQKTVVGNVTKQVNKYIKLIALDLGITKNITSYTARHTFAMVLKRNNVSPAIIQDTLGHSSPNTTKEYLSTLNADELRNSLQHILIQP